MHLCQYQLLLTDVSALCHFGLQVMLLLCPIIFILTGWDLYPVVDLFPASRENTAMPSKNNPDTSGYFHVNFIPCLIALLIIQSAHREYSSVNDIMAVLAELWTLEVYYNSVNYLSYWDRSLYHWSRSCAATLNRCVITVKAPSWSRSMLVLHYNKALVACDDVRSIV